MVMSGNRPDAYRLPSPASPRARALLPFLLHDAWLRRRRPAVTPGALGRSITGFLDVSKDGGAWPYSQGTRDTRDSRKGPWWGVWAGLVFLQLRWQGLREFDCRICTESPLGARS